MPCACMQAEQSMCFNDITFELAAPSPALCACLLVQVVQGCVGAASVEDYIRFTVGVHMVVILP